MLIRQYDIWNAIQRFRGIKSELIELLRKSVVLSYGLKQKLRNKEVDIWWKIATYYFASAFPD